MPFPIEASPLGVVSDDWLSNSVALLSKTPARSMVAAVLSRLSVARKGGYSSVVESFSAVCYIIGVLVNVE